MPSPRKLRHRPSDELIDIRERGLPWLISVFLVLFFLLCLLLVFFIITTRDIYLIQSGKISESSGESSEDLDNLHVDVVPIIDRRTGFSVEEVMTTEPSIRLVLAEEVHNLESDKYETFNSEPPTTTISEGYWKYPTQPATDFSKIQETETPATVPTTEGLEGQANPTNTSSEDFSESLNYSITPGSVPDVIEVGTELRSEQPVHEEVSTVSSDTPTSIPIIHFEETSSPSPETSLNLSQLIYLDPHQTLAATTPLPKLAEDFKIDAKLEKQINWKREPRTRADIFQKFAISTHHNDCSEIGRKIFELGGNAVDAAISAEFCVSAVHPHATGPGFGNVMVVHSRKRNGTFVIDGRERAPRFANQNTFVTNPSIAHIGYSSMGVPGWISTLWIAFKQFGSGRVDWKHIIEPTINLMLRGLTIDRHLATAFESRKNHVLHEKSFGTLFTKTSKEGESVDNFEYLDFLQSLSNSTQSEHDFYRGKIAKQLVDEMKSRGGLITRADLESFTSIVTRAEIMPVDGESHFLAGPHLPYYFPIMAKIFSEIQRKFAATENADEKMEFFDELIPLMQNANSMKLFVGDDHFEPEVKSKIDEWSKPPNFKSEQQVEQLDNKRKIPAFSRIVALDNDGNAVNYMSINSVPFGSVRRSPTFGFVWNNAMSSFDVFCKHDVNCVKGGQRPAVRQSFPSILLDARKNVRALLSPTFAGLQTTATTVLQTTFLNLTFSDSLNTPRIYTSPDEIKIETGIPDELFRHLWSTKHAKFTHPTNPLTVLSSDFHLYCDHRDNYRVKTCNPAGV